ncbi:hypothetical protein [Synechococcus sp. H55.11]|uniref:hypothetical protein n=1 Tax=unclassified Synechococcus TaxID=2626047 RepID=UPI0039C40DCE
MVYNSEKFKQAIQECQGCWRQVVASAPALGILFASAVPGTLLSISASLAYYDSCRTANLPQNFTQA